jgi:hypothetical protein
LMTFGSQFRRASAQALLRSPDQLMNTSMSVIVRRTKTTRST